MKRKRSRGWADLGAPRLADHHVIRNGEGPMMKQFMRALLCLCLLLPLGAKAEEFTDVFVFGNSLSDTGNLAAFIDVVGFGFPVPTPIPIIGLCNPEDILLVPPGKGFCGDLFFLQSRVSNGPVAVEFLANNLPPPPSMPPLAVEPSLHFLPRIVGFGSLRPPDFGTNYAVAGARARARIELTDLPIDLADPDPAATATKLRKLGDLNVQIVAFLDDHPSAPSDALYVVMIGGNDVIDAAGALLDALLGLSSTETSKDLIADAVDEIGRSIDALIGADDGAGARKFLVVNSPNIGSLPLDFPRVKSGLVRTVATFVTIKFNEQLAERLDQIQADQPLVEINQFDLFRFFE